MAKTLSFLPRAAAVLMVAAPLGGCAAEGALANAMIVEGDAEGNLVKLTEDGLPLCSPANAGVVFYLHDTDELVYCAGDSYRVMGGGVCDGDGNGAEAGVHADGGPDTGTHLQGEAGAPADGAVVQTVACLLSSDGSGPRTLRCEDGTALTLPGDAVDASTDGVP